MKNIKDQIQPYLDRKLCTMKQSTTFPDLYVVKYARRVFYDTNMKNRFDVGVDNRKDVKMTPFTWDDIMNRLAAYVDGLKTEINIKTKRA